MSAQQLSDAELFAIAGIQPSAPATPAATPAVGAGDPKQPRNMRNNNPGNIEDGPFARGLPGYAGSDGRFAIFDDPQAGTAAKLRLLKSYGERGFDTPREIIGRWAPASDGNDVDGYASFVSQKLGVSPDDPLDMMDDATLMGLAGAIQEFEGGPAMAALQGEGSDLTAMSDEELLAAAGLAQPTTEDTEVAELVVEGAPPGQRERIFQPIKDFAGPAGRAIGEGWRDLKAYVSAESDPDRNLGDTLPTMAKAGRVLLAPLKIAGGLAEGAVNQITGPLGRLAARTPLPIYGPTAYGEMPVPLEGDARGEAFTGALNTAASGARALPRMGPPRPPRMRATRGERRVGAAVERAIDRDQLTPDLVRQNLAADPDLPAFQAGGENMRATADVLAQSPGAANVTLRAAARDSQAKAPSRIREEIGRTFDATGNYFAKVDEMKAARKAAAEPYRERAFNASVEAVPYAEKVAPLIARVPQRAMAYAAEIARREGRNPSDVGFEVSPASGDIPEMVRVSRPTMETLHYIKKGMDQELEQFRTALGGIDTTGNPLAGATASLRSDYARALREVNPDYDKYMQIWGDESGQIEALRLGREAFSGKQGVSAEQLRKRYGEMSQAEQDNYRLGLGEALFDMVNRRGVQAARQVLKSDEFKDRVRVAVPDETSFNDFMKALERQVVIQDRNTSIAGGSPTAYRQAARADLENEGVNAADIVSGGVDMIAGIPPRAIAAKVLREGLSLIPRKDPPLLSDPELNAALGRALADPQEMRRILDLMEMQRTSRANSSRAALRASLPLLALPSPQGQQTTR